MSTGGFRTDPRPIVQAVFERIDRERMHDVPLCNRALTVDITDFIAWAGLWVGVVITPWAMNLMLLPGAGGGEDDNFMPLRVGQIHEWEFPSGCYPFMGNHEPGLGEYHYCSLFSPMDGFADPAAAREVALASLDELFNPPVPELPPAVDRRAFLRRAFGHRVPA
jgi:[NiFe] hydrogenase assembly HybE family chaperone